MLVNLCLHFISRSLYSLLYCLLLAFYAPLVQLTVESARAPKDRIAAQCILIAILIQYNCLSVCCNVCCNNCCKSWVSGTIQDTHLGYDDTMQEKLINWVKSYIYDTVDLPRSIYGARSKDGYKNMCVDKLRTQILSIKFLL